MMVLGQHIFKWKTVLSQILMVSRNEFNRLKQIRYYPNDWLTASYVSVESPILIGGAGRSGTTLLSAMLNAHPEIYCGAEYGLFSTDAFSLTAISSNLGLAYDQLEQVACQSANRRQFWEQVIRLTQKAHNIKRVATKNPNYMFEVANILSTFPNAHFIHIYRDGRDVAVSMRKHADQILLRYDATYDDQNLLSIKYCAETWRTFINAYQPWVHDNRCYQIAYEDLILHAEQALLQLCKFLNISYDTAMLDFHHKGIQDRTDAHLPHLLGLQEALYSDSIEQWKKVLFPDQVREFESYAGQELEYLGYKRQCQL